MPTITATRNLKTTKTTDGIVIEFELFLKGEVGYHFEAPSHNCPGEEWVETLKLTYLHIEKTLPHCEAEVVDGDWVGCGGGFTDWELNDEASIRRFLTEHKIDADDVFSLEDVDYVDDDGPDPDALHDARVDAMADDEGRRIDEAYEAYREDQDNLV